MSFITSLQLGAVLAAWLATSPPGVVTALAVREDAWVVGTDLGLFVREDGVWRRFLARGGVLDVARSPDALWIATAGGLYAWPDAESEPRRVALGAGAYVRSVAVDGRGGVWVASQAGLFRRDPGEAAFEREIGIPPGEVHAVRAAGGQLWIAMRESLWRGERGSFVRELVSVEEGWWELRGAVEVEGEIWLCVPRGLWRMRRPSPQRLDPGLGELHAAAVRSGELWLASQRGVFRFAAGAIGPARGRNVLAGSARRLAVVPDALLAAGERGIARLETVAPAAAATGAAQVPDEPGIGRVQRAVLAYLEIEPARMTRVEKRSRRSGWMPELQAGVSLDRARGWESDFDQVFSSGAVRKLFDSSADRGRDLQLQFELSWDLAETASPDDAIAISRERRLLVELRDQVLERVKPALLRAPARTRRVGAGTGGTALRVGPARAGTGGAARCLDRRALLAHARCHGCAQGIRRGGRRRAPSRHRSSDGSPALPPASLIRWPPPT